MYKYFIGILFSLFLLSCKTISVNQQPQLLTETYVQIGAIGIVHDNMLHKSFENIAIPVFKKEIKLNIQSVSFSKQTFKAFSKANEQTKKITLTYSDSLEVKPEYMLLQFVDRVAIASELNNAKNTGLRSYLENKKDAQIITGISVAFSKSQHSLLKKAEEVFLVQSSSKKFSLQLTDIAGKKQNLEFSSCVVFAYQTSSFCWKENDRHKLVIADIVSNSEGCPPNTYRKAEKAVQKNDYSKL